LEAEPNAWRLRRNYVILHLDDPMCRPCVAGLDGDDAVTADDNIRPARWRTGAVDDVAAPVSKSSISRRCT
jgi:hypothetical protein